MLINDYFMEPNPYAKRDKYYMDPLEENYTKMAKTRDISLGNSDKLNYKLLALLVGVFCIHFYVLSLIAQKCFTFFITTFLLNNTMALQCQHYTYHLIHFLLAHFFTFASKLLFDKASQLTNLLLTKTLIVRHKLHSFDITVEKTEDKQALISNFATKNRKRRKLKNKTKKKDFFERLQLGSYQKIKSSKKMYQKLTHDQPTITSYYCNYMKTVNSTMGNFQILAVSEVNYIDVSRTQIDGDKSPLASPGPSQNKNSAYYTIHNTGANNRERNNSKTPFSRIFDNGLSKRIECKSINVGAIKNTISKHLKNKHVLFKKMKKRGVHFKNTIVTKCSRRLKQGEKLLSKEKRKFKWKKRHKEYVVFKIVSQKRMGDGNELTFVTEVRNAVKDKPLKVDCECFKYDFAFEDIHEIEDKTDWYTRRYQRTVGNATEKSIERKNILRSLKRQALGVIGLWSPTAFGYSDQVDSNLQPLELDWGKSPKAVLCGCPVTECICGGNTRTQATSIPNAGLIDANLPKMMVIQLFHELCGCCCDRCLRKMAPSPASTLMPRLSNAVSLRKVFYLEKRSDNLPAEMCSHKCKNFFFKNADKQDFDDVAVISVHDRADSKNLDKFADEIYHDRTNEVNERVSGTRLSGNRLASDRLPSGKVPSDGVPGEGFDGDNVSSGRVSGQELDGDKVPSGRAPGEGFDGESPMIGDGFVEEEIEGAGETPVYSKDDNIYARGFILTTATQTQFDENGKLLREETDRIKIAFKLRYTTKKDIEGKQIDIEICDPCAPVYPTSELTIGTIKHHISNVKKGIEGTLKTLSGTVSSYTRSWKLGLEEMSEHISSYAKGLQSRVGFGLGERKDDLSVKGTVPYNPSFEGIPKYNSDYFEKAKYPTKGFSWPDITPRMRYNESNQTDNLSSPLRSENELITKLKKYLNNLRQRIDNQIHSARNSKTNIGPICCQKSHSDGCLIRTKETHDFFECECKASNSDKEVIKPLVKCACHHPKPSLEGGNVKEVKKPLVKFVCPHPKSSPKGENDIQVIKPCQYQKSSQARENDKAITKPLVKCPCHHLKSQEEVKTLVKCMCHHPKSSLGAEITEPLVKCLCHHPKSSLEEGNDKKVMKPLAKCVYHHPKKSPEENGKKTTKQSLSTGKLSSTSINIVTSVPKMRRSANERFP